MTVSYAGVALGYQTPELIGFIESHIDPSDVFQFAAQTWPGPRLVGLPFRQGQTPPPVRINRLYWPTGASRFSIAHFLVDQAQLNAIRAVVYATNYDPAFLLMSDGLNAIATYLWMLPARPLQTLTDLPLFLLTLVDERFFWWFRSSSLAVEGGVTTWESLLTQIASALGITLTGDTIDADYLMPDPAFTLSDEPLPLILDAVCACIGQRFVRQLDGTCYLWNAETSRDQTALQVAALLLPTAGLDGSAGGAFALGTDVPLIDDVTVLPAVVEVIYPVQVAGVPSGEIAYTVSLSGLSLADFAGITGFSGTKTYHCSAVAMGTGTPTNDTELQALTERIATDFYRFQCGRLDLRLVGYPAWVITGLDDQVQYQHENDCATRVMRGPWLDHMEEMGFWSSGGSSAASLTVGEVDLSPLYTNITTILFDQADGFVVSQPGAGQAKVKLTTGGSAFSGARVYETSSQSIPYGTDTAILFSAEEYDTDSYHSTTSNTSRLTIPSDGYYQVSASLVVPAGGNSQLYLVTMLRGNGSGIIAGEYKRQNIGFPTSSFVTATAFFTAGNYVEVVINQSLNFPNMSIFSGATLGSLSGNSPVFWINRLGT